MSAASHGSQKGGKSNAGSSGSRHQWTDEERQRLINYMKKSRDLQQALLLGRSQDDVGRTIKHNDLLRACAREIHPGQERTLEPIQVRRQIESMNKKYDTAWDLLSETGKSKTASELPEHGFLREERSKAVKKCWFFEDWHEMRRDRKATAPEKIRVAGGEGSVRVGRGGMRRRDSDDLMDDLLSPEAEGEEDDESEGGTHQSAGEDNEEDNGRLFKKAKTAKSTNSTSKPPISSSSTTAAAGGSKRSHGSSSAVDTLAASMRESMKEREERSQARDRMEQDKIDIARMEAETRRMEAETARDMQRQQTELLKAMMNKFTS
ncbi:unnamed protein product [Tilletia controversa]|nr:unnamed protein product [Tilletia controversa]